MESILLEPEASNVEEIRKRHEHNRIAWNDGAECYTRAREECLTKLKEKKSSLHPLERKHLAGFGPLSQWCQRAIHLQCASGEDTLSLWLEGAHEVVGVDISDVHIENARWLAQQLHAPAEFVRCDILDTPVRSMQQQIWSTQDKGPCVGFTICQHGAAL